LPTLGPRWSSPSPASERTAPCQSRLEQARAGRRQTAASTGGGGPASATRPPRLHAPPVSESARRPAHRFRSAGAAGARPAVARRRGGAWRRRLGRAGRTSLASGGRHLLPRAKRGTPCLGLNRWASRRQSAQQGCSLAALLVALNRRLIDRRFSATTEAAPLVCRSPCSPRLPPPLLSPPSTLSAGPARPTPLDYLPASSLDPCRPYPSPNAHPRLSLLGHQLSAGSGLALRLGQRWECRYGTVAMRVFPCGCRHGGVSLIVSPWACR
jgi:hypothetical protein